MYHWGQISIDPSQLTHIEKKPPTKGFAKLAHVLTAGLVTPKEEQETFSAVSILQQLNIAMRSIGVDNIIRLSKDDNVIYEDREGRTGDLKEAMDIVTEKLATTENLLFDKLELDLEHATSDLRYLIGIEINRTHRVGKFPIVITVNGLLEQYGRKDGETEEQVKERVSALFVRKRSKKKRKKESKQKVQSRYDRLLEETESSFNKFLDRIEGAIRETMDVDEAIRNSRVAIVRPNNRISSIADIPSTGNSDLVYRGYHGVSDAFFYAWMWSDMCYSHNIHCHNCLIVDDQGKDFMEVGQAGFNANDNDIFNTETELEEVPVDTYSSDHFESESSTPVSFDQPSAPSSEDSGFTDQSSDSTEDSGGWFGGLFDGDWGGGGDGDGGGDGGGSCGGGCGGCGGG